MIRESDPMVAAAWCFILLLVMIAGGVFWAVHTWVL